MLTKTDLKQIEQVVKGVTDPEFRQIDLRFDHVEKRLTNIDKKLDFVTGYFDRAEIRMTKRIKKLEDHYNIVATPY